MTLVAGSFVVRADEAETLRSDSVTMRLLADSSDTNGTLSTLRVTLAANADGARPHRHDGSSELFYVLDGEVDVLSGDSVLTGRQGDVIVVPAGLPHAFAARAAGGDLLIVIAPGVERFEYFRHLRRIAEGELPPESLLEVQDRYDTYFLNSDSWARRGLPE